MEVTSPPQPAAQQAQIQIRQLPARKRTQAERIKKISSIVRTLGKTTVVLAVLLLGTGTAEALVVPCEEVYDYRGYYVIGCYNASIGQAIWCSVIPLIAGIFGISIGSRSTSQQKVGLAMGFNIAGAITTSVLVIIQPIVAELTNNMVNKRNSVLYGLQIFICFVACINLFMLVVSASYTCCLCETCCIKFTTEASDRVIYIPYNPNQRNEPSTSSHSRGFPNAAYQPKLIQMVPINSPPGFNDQLVSMTTDANRSRDPPKYEELEMTTKL